jgi:hypothetical protein
MLNLKGPTTRSNDTLPSQPQGVTGTVFSSQGNQMPGNIARSSGLLPVQTKVWIFSDRVTSPGSPRWSLEKARQHSNLVGWGLSDDEGNFSIGLPPGEYTLLAEYGQDLYLNSFLGDGSYASIQVHPLTVTEVQLANTDGAAF